MIGRFAPSPTGPLHVGNLRTALLSWLFAKAGSGQWLVRMEDLDRVTSSREHESDQLHSLELIGLGSDVEVVRQSDRFDRYHSAIAELAELGLVYPCYCTRSEIRAAAAAPHGAAPEGAYPGTCRHLTVTAKGELERDGRRPALRLVARAEVLTVDDLVAGRYVGAVDDVVLQRNDGVPAYNLAVVVDDAAQGITQVVRGDDLLESTPRQMLLQRLLGLSTPTYAHVPLAVAPDGSRLAKRHGAVTLGDFAELGVSPTQVLALIGASLGLCAEGDTVTPDVLLTRFDPVGIPREPWCVTGRSV